MKRTVIPELLDSDSGSPEEVRDSLDDLRWLNRHFGGSRTTAFLLSRVATERRLQRLTLLDVAGATGDVAEDAARILRERNIDLKVTLLDRAASHLRTSTTSTAVVGDAFHLPFADEAFDVVGSALFVHHLEPQQVAAFVNESLRVARHACVVNDLRRGTFHLFAAYAGRLLYRSRITRHDAVASVRRAYTPAELEKMLSRSDAARVESSRHFLCRMGTIAWKAQRNAKS